MIYLKLVALVFVFNFQTAYAFPKAPIDDLNFRPSVEHSKSATQYDFEGIVKLSNCSGSLIQFEGQTDDAKAVVLTNGHCVKKSWFGGFLSPGEVWINRSRSRGMKVFKDKNTLFNIRATKIIYATMTDTDMALFELNETYNQIKERTGVTPLTLASERSYESVSIDIVSGYWERGYSCGIDKFIYKVKEADWTFRDSIRYTAGCDTVGGTSGSPIIEAGTRKVIGVNNSSNESGRRCSMNNPCEVNEVGEVYFKKGLRYGQQTFNVYTCLNANKVLDMNRRGCSLPKQ